MSVENSTVDTVPRQKQSRTNPQPTPEVPVRHQSLHSHALTDIPPDGIVIVEDVTPHKHKPTPLTGAVQHVGTQAARLRHTVVKNVHHAQKAAARYLGPRATAAGVGLVGAGGAALGVEVIGEDNAATAMKQLGSTNAAAAAEELGVAGVLKVSKRLGPVGIGKVAIKLGPRGIMNLSSHITSSMADSIRAEAAQINPDQNAPQLKQVVGRVAAELKHVTDDQLAGEQLLPGGGGGGGGGSSSSSRCEQGQPAPVTPALALAAALVQLVLIVLEGMLRIISDVMHAGVRLWDRLHEHGSSSSLLVDVASAHESSSRKQRKQVTQHIQEQQHTEQEGCQYGQGSVDHDVDADMF